ncbi:unnamed protein product [Owenia fusiformis]|uniref:Uncharacterized protein n=1 Tax=Owenia fusiformis TaxID=6347 RepID=A0A8J1TV58_OWEFU|nr:unnamed protein product [Owenia fusiformis]
MEESYLFLGLCTFTIVKFCSILMVNKNRIRNAPIVGTLAGIFIYPIKSCKGIKVEEAECTWEGLKCFEAKDRHWMIINNDNRMITARDEPTLLLINPSFHGNMMHLDAPGMPTVKVPTEPNIEGALVYTVKVFGHVNKGMDCGQEVSDWLSEYLKRPGTKLIYQHPKLELPDVADENARTSDKVAYGDEVTYSMLSEASVNDLNSRLDGKQVTVNSFRPNLYVKGCNAFDEDTWEYSYIEDASLWKMKQTARCVLTTIDTEKGERDENQQPLKTLKSYRPKAGESPCFGISLSPDNPGVIKVGDNIRAWV